MRGLIYARSSLAAEKGLAPANRIGVIDGDYRGELPVCMFNQSAVPQTPADGERLAQMVLTPCYTAGFSEAQPLSDTVRGTGGFGSAGSRSPFSVPVPPHCPARFISFIKTGRLQNSFF
jgi:dUTP pyrophosphatase